MLSKVLIVDDDPVHAALLERIVARMGHSTHVVDNGETAIELLTGPTSITIDAVLLDLVMPDLDGMAVLRRLRTAGSALPVIMMVTPAGVDSVMAAIKAGANDFAVKPVSPERLSVALMNALRLSALASGVETDRLKRSDSLTLNTLYEDDPLFLRLGDRAEKAAQSSLPLIIQGEEGTGKTLLARAVHGSSSRSAKAFMRFDALASQEGSSLSSLMSVLAAARGGTLLIESVERLAPAAQNGLASWSGWTTSSAVTPRIITTTRTSLIDAVRGGRFREDLFYRLSALSITLKPLRERPDDLPRMAERIVQRLAYETGKMLHGLAPDALASLKNHAWNGNYPEFAAALIVAVARASGPFIQASDFETGLTAHPPIRAPIESHPEFTVSLLDGHGALRPFSAIETEILALARNYCHGSLGRAAELLGLGRSTLYRKFREPDPSETKNWTSMGDAA
jgi:DNA-binding NtrC family response regulator